MRKLTVIGLIIGTVALVATTLLDADSWPFGREAVAVSLVGYMGAAAGMICQRLDKVNRPADEAFESGWEIGHDAGWRECTESMRPKVVRLKRESS